MKEVVLKTNNLCKKYKDFTVLDNVNININKGDIYGLIGRNGAGKTTLMRIITTLTDATSGEFELFGKKGEELTQSKKRIGCLIEEPAFFPNLTAYENLKYYAIQKGIADMTKIDETLELVGLKENKNKKIKNFSLGMEQRLGIALSILDDPDFLILDEPINAIDPIGISEMRELFKKLNEERNITILISSHILTELYMLATKFCFLENGKIIKEITKEELDIECSKCIVIKTDDVKKVCTVLEKNLNTTNYKVINQEEIRLYNYLGDSSKVNKELVKNDINVKQIQENGISLEDYFKQLMQEVK